MSPAPLEIIVVLDGEDDGSGAAAAAAGARVLQLPNRCGPAIARNTGAGAARGDIFLFMDADVVPPSGCVGQVAASFNNRPELAAVIGSYDDEPGEPHFLSQYRNLLHHYIHQTSNQQAQTFWGACGAVRRDAFYKVGGFDESIDLPAMEDVELGYRLRRAGYRIGLIKQIQVKHLKRWDALTMLRTDIFQRAIPWARLLLREGTLHDDLNLRKESRYSAVLAWLGLCALLLSAFYTTSLYPAALAAALLLLLNAPLYAFFRRKRGVFFLLRAVPWHWLYYLYSSAAFAYVVFTECFNSGRRSAVTSEAGSGQSRGGSL